MLFVKKKSQLLIVTCECRKCVSFRSKPQNFVSFRITTKFNVSALIKCQVKMLLVEKKSKLLIVTCECRKCVSFRSSCSPKILLVFVLKMNSMCDNTDQMLS